MASWLVKGQGGTLTLQLRDGDGDPVDATGLPTIVVKDPTGATIASGTSTKPAATTGLYEFAVTGAQAAALDELTATWTAVVAGDTKTISTSAQIVGGHLIGLAEIRELEDGKDNGLGNTTRYPADRIRTARQWATEAFEKAANRAFTPRAARETLSGDDTPLLIVPHNDLRTVRSVTVDGTTWTASDVGLHIWGGLVAPAGTVWTKGQRNIEVCYEYGLDAPPERVTTAIAILARLRATPSSTGGLATRATSESTDYGTFRLTIAGRDGAFGIPEVDTALIEYGLRKPAVGAINY